METNIREMFPHIFPKSSDCREFDGFISIAGEDVHVRISVIEKTVHVRGRWNTNADSLLLQTKMESQTSLLSILLELKAKLESETRDKLIKKQLFSSAGFASVLESLDRLGWEKIETMDEDLEHLVLKSMDGKGRMHQLQIHFSTHKSAPPFTYSADVPTPFVASKKAIENIEVIFNEFQEQLKMYQCFWDVLDEIDENTWVLEPENPTRKDCKRRLALSKRTSLQICVDTSRPTSIPECDFFGPDKEIAPLRNLYVTNIESWDENQSVLTNLKCILAIDFPSRHTTSKEEIQENCVICYSYRLNDSVPDKTCEQCTQVFHVECLFEWLHQLASTRHSFNVLFGECPFCSKPITCKML